LRIYVFLYFARVKDFGDAGLCICGSGVFVAGYAADAGFGSAGGGAAVATNAGAGALRR
jgi:hypothetical protein